MSFRKFLITNGKQKRRLLASEELIVSLDSVF
jgi:hypothetical protein